MAKPSYFFSLYYTKITSFWVCFIILLTLFFSSPLSLQQQPFTLSLSLSPAVRSPHLSLVVMPLFLSFSLSCHRFSLSLARYFKASLPFSLSLYYYYFFFGLLLCLVLGVWVLRKHGKAKGNRFLFSLIYLVSMKLEATGS